MWPSRARSTSTKQVSSTCHFSCVYAVSGALTISVEMVELVFLVAGLTGGARFWGLPLERLRLPTVHNEV